VLLGPFIKSNGAADCRIWNAMGTRQQCLFAIGLLSAISYVLSSLFLSVSANNHSYFLLRFLQFRVIGARSQSAHKKAT